MKQMVFVGEHKELSVGLTALVRDGESGKVLAQFDDRFLQDGSDNEYAYNWHEFNRSDFVSVEEHLGEEL